MSFAQKTTTNPPQQNNPPSRSTMPLVNTAVFNSPKAKPNKPQGTIATSSTPIASATPKPSQTSTMTPNRQPRVGNTNTGSAYAEPDSPIASAIKRNKAVATPSTKTPSRAAAVTPASTKPTSSAVSKTPVTPVTAQPQSQQPPASPHLFSPKFEDPHARNHNDERGNAANAKSNGHSGSVTTLVTTGKLGSSRAIEQKGPVHSYNPPCMQAVFKALQCKNANNQIFLSNLAEVYMEDDHVPDEEEFDAFYFIKSLPALSTVVPAPRKSPIPFKAPDTPMVTLALDLDETLVHCSIQPIENPEFTFHVNFNGMDYEVYVRIRPHLEYFLKQVSQWFEVVVFTASQKVYADSLLNIIDPMNEYISHRVFRDSCVCVDGNYLKDLNILGRPLDKVVIVDNSFQAFGFQLDNGIPIESWFDDENDCELLNLVPFLRHLKDSIDVRPYVRDTFRLQEFVDCLVNPYE